MKMVGTIEAYLSPSKWRKRYEEEIKWVKLMKKGEKFDIIIQLNLMGLRLIEANDKERKIKAYQKRSVIDRERLKNFIKHQLEK